jgi:O-antigen ligase
VSPFILPAAKGMLDAMSSSDISLLEREAKAAGSTTNHYQAVMLTLARGATAAMAAALPFSTAATNAFAAIAFFAWILSGKVLIQVRRAARDPVVLGAIAATLFVLAGVLWSSAELAASAEAAAKYRKLILLAMLVMLLDESRWRQAVLAVFFGSTVLLLLASIGVYLRLPGFPAANELQGAILQRSHITQGLLMALLAAAALIWSSKPRALWLKLVAWVIAAAALANLFGMIQGRTGYLVVAVLAFWAGWRRFSWRGAAAAGLVLATLAFVAYANLSTVKHRLDLVASDLDRFKAGEIDTPSGRRLHFYQRALQIIADNPVFGAGTGAWATEYNVRSGGDPASLAKAQGLGNPHNDYLLVAVQWGSVGLLLMLGALVGLYRLASRLPSQSSRLAQASIVAYSAGALVNSFLWDAGEGMMFVLLWGALFAEQRLSQHDGS